MRVRRPWLMLVLVVLTPATAHAHDHFADVFAAASFIFGSTLPGFHVSYSQPVREASSRETRVTNVSVVGDFSAHWDSDDSDRRHVNYMGGVRYTFARTPTQQALPFVHAMVGGMHARDRGRGDADPVVAIGGGFEYVWTGSPKGLGFRVQADYIVQPGDINPRLSAGFVWRK